METKQIKQRIPLWCAVVNLDGRLHRGINALNEWVRRRDERRFRELIDFKGKELCIDKEEFKELCELLCDGAAS